MFRLCLYRVGKIWRNTRFLALMGKNATTGRFCILVAHFCIYLGIFLWYHHYLRYDVINQFLCPFFIVPIKREYLLRRGVKFHDPLQYVWDKNNVMTKKFFTRKYLDVFLTQNDCTQKNMLFLCLILWYMIFEYWFIIVTNAT